MLEASRNVNDKSKNKIQYKTITHTLYSVRNQENKKSTCIYEIRHYKLIKQKHKHINIKKSMHTVNTTYM